MRRHLGLQLVQMHMGIGSKSGKTQQHVEGRAATSGTLWALGSRDAGNSVTAPSWSPRCHRPTPCKHRILSLRSPECLHGFGPLLGDTWPPGRAPKGRVGGQA